MSFRQGLLLVVLVAAVVSFTGINDNSVIHYDDEGLYVQVASEMYDRGELWMPYFMGQPNGYNKPPLFYWLAMLLFPSGLDRFLLTRLAVAAVGFITIGFVYAIGNTLYGRRQGILAALLSASCLGYFIFGRVAMFEMLLTLSLTIPMYCLLRAWQGRSAKWAGWFVFATSCSFMVKGPVTMVILTLAALLILGFFGRWRPFFSGSALKGALAGILPVIAWPAAIAYQGDFPRWFKSFILHENLTKFKDPDAYPIGGFLSNILVWFAPWSLLLLATLGFILLARRWRKFEYAFPLCWAFAIIGIYLLPDTRIHYYLLPVIIPASLLVAAALTEMPRWMPFRLANLATAALLLLVAGVVVNLLRGPAAGSLLFVGASVAALLAALTAAWFLWRQKNSQAAVAVALFLALIAVSLQQVSPAKLPPQAAELLSPRERAVSISRIKATMVVHYYWYYNHKLNKYCGDARTVAQVKDTMTNGRIYLYGQPVAVPGKEILLVMGETDRRHLAEKEPELVRRLETLYSWRQWKEQMTNEDIGKVLKSGDVSPAQETLYIFRYR